MHSAIGKNKIYRCTKSIILPIKQKEKAALPNGRTAILNGEIQLPVVTGA
jgi:hypothetical protein